jgi:hypothetical protein
MPVCVALAHLVVALLPTDAFSLSWTHSVEKTHWREEWRIVDGRLHLAEAAIEGSGAGMDPPPDAVFTGGEWRYHPDVVPAGNRLVLANSAFGGGYQLCWTGRCQPLADMLPTGDSGPLELYPCNVATR